MQGVIFIEELSKLVQIQLIKRHTNKLKIDDVSIYYWNIESKLNKKWCHLINMNTINSTHIYMYVPVQHM